MNILTKATKLLSRVGGRPALLLRKVSPEILIGAGIIGVVGAGIWACASTLKLSPILADAKEDIDELKKWKEEIEDGAYTNKEFTQDMVKVYGRTVWNVARIYAGPVLVGAASIGCLVGSHHILKKRNAALIGAYKLIDESFKKYRVRVIDELGEEKDKEYRYGITTKQITETTVSKNGKEKTITKTQQILDTKNLSAYACIFNSETSREFCPSGIYNLHFLKSQQDYMNELLHARSVNKKGKKGHVFLNEVYDALGMERTPAGAVVGWVFDTGEEFIDFGIYQFNAFTEQGGVIASYDLEGNPLPRAQMHDDGVLLDFNVQGIIYDLI